MDTTSISLAPHSKRPEQIHEGDEVRLDGMTARVREVSETPAWPLATERWVIDAVSDGTEIVAPRGRNDLVEVVSCPHPQGVAA